ncbi:MAG TPA: dihydrolipoamide acetyltransferase family protein [Cryomorphaceae bacterium]|nr:dihydrolipoamide acetyltransferase family protein [Cryomorphaceae bacterium]
MPQIEVLLPKMGESVAEATIIKWVLEEGDSVEADEPMVEIATDKVDSEVPAPEDGILVKKLCEEGDVVEVGRPIALFSVGADKAESSSAPTAESKTKAVPASNGAEKSQKEPALAEVSDAGGAKLSKTGPSGRFYSPLVRNIAEKEGVSLQELEQLEGSGADGRVTKKDILNYIPNRETSPAKESPSTRTEETKESAPKQSATGSSGINIKAPSIKVGADDEIVEMDRMRKLISDHMVTSKHVSPHVTSYVEADVTNIVTWRNKWKNKFQEREGEKLTFTPIFIEAIAQAIKEMRGVNVSTDGENIIKRKHINIGMAAALPSGNLIVPVIHDADQLNLLGITKKVNDLAARARENKLRPEEIQGGTYTLTNVGTFGNVMGTPIINQPQAAIMAVGAIRKKPAVIETPEGDFIGIRHMMFLSHAYDHRIIDGALGGSFVRRVADLLEGFDINREI